MTKTRAHRPAWAKGWTARPGTRTDWSSTTAQFLLELELAVCQEFT